MLRLAALRESPDAFGSTLRPAEQRRAAQWRQQVQEIATFVAVSAGIDVGLARVAPDETDPYSAFLLSMWVAPDARGQSVGEQLIQAVAGWARTAGFGQLLLDVADKNMPAVALYTRMNFQPTGKTGSLPPPRTHIREHRRALLL